MLECPACGQQFEPTDTRLLPSHKEPDTQNQCPYSGRLGLQAEIAD